MDAMRTDGDWGDYVADVHRLVDRYRPRRVLELGCGFFTAAEACFATGTQLYVGVDQWPNPRREAIVRAAYPDRDIVVFPMKVEDFRCTGHFDAVLIDAHGPDYEGATQAQCRIADMVSAPLIVVDDCRIEVVAKTTDFYWGPPTGKGEGVTGVWWWTR
jgi:hypothetical protein